MWTWWYRTSTFEHSEQPSPISEGVAEIQINSHIARYQPVNTTHVSHEGTRVATFHDDYQRVEPGPPYPSVVFHAKTLTGSPWVARTLSQCHLWSTVGCRPTQRPSKLLSLRDPMNPVCASTQLNAYCSMAQSTRSLIDTSGDYHLRCSEYKNRPLSTFPFGILHFSLVAPPGLT
jgi:hypothetical protein